MASSQPKAGAPQAAAGVTECEAVSIGGDRLSLSCHRAWPVSELRDGGWTAETIADRGDAEFGPSQQPYGILLPAFDLS